MNKLKRVYIYEKENNGWTYDDLGDEFHVTRSFVGKVLGGSRKFGKLRQILLDDYHEELFGY